ncbi:hypothetical protein FA15DRAFT_655181 [Coprinopsis marcescibilis]|uniref:Uncharacterized protein n=1 Tax=Coprinopsis marcescibilis TaxID=230819 RepID=A0A5C3KY38_COPMA|nr:hypothetical protein FA15DRAFT_655181 [Coprinopsis marcescibilis]
MSESKSEAGCGLKAEQPELDCTPGFDLDRQLLVLKIGSTAPIHLSKNSTAHGWVKEETVTVTRKVAPRTLLVARKEDFAEAHELTLLDGFGALTHRERWETSGCWGEESDDRSRAGEKKCSRRVANEQEADRGTTSQPTSLLTTMALQSQRNLNELFHHLRIEAQPQKWHNIWQITSYN